MRVECMCQIRVDLLDIIVFHVDPSRSLGKSYTKEDMERDAKSEYWDRIEDKLYNSIKCTCHSGGE